jgi:hypothetical protein
MVPELDPNKIQIQRIVSSKAFKTSEVHRNLFNYLAEKSLGGEAHNLKEYTVGLDVFGKPASYDPRQESVVRMHVGRLRQKLAEYYRTEGADDAVIVDLPKGGFGLTFELRPVPLAPPPVERVAPATPVPAPRRFSGREVALAAALLVALVATTYLGVRLSSVKKVETAAPAPGPWTADLQTLWAPLLTSDRPLMVTLATGAANGSAPSPSGAATNASSVTGVGTANAAFLLGQFLGQRKHNVFPIRSDVLSMGEIAMGDVIFVGPTVGKPQIQAIPPVDAAFVLTPEGVRNVKPGPGESPFMADAPAARGGAQDVVEESHALISNLPGLYGNGSILYFEGNQIASVMGAVQAMTDPDLASQLVGRLKKPDGTLPRYYQVVLKVRAMDETPVDISYVAHRELTISKRPLAVRGGK